jgi:hypothetical protein
MFSPTVLKSVHTFSAHICRFSVLRSWLSGEMENPERKISQGHTAKGPGLTRTSHEVSCKRSDRGSVKNFDRRSELLSVNGINEETIRHRELSAVP